MEKNIKDYLHFYLGCEVRTDLGIETLVAVGLLGSDEQRFNTLQPFMSHRNLWKENNKPILRPLSDMTEEEKMELAKMIHPKPTGFKVTLGVSDSLSIEAWGDGMRNWSDNYSPKMVVYLTSIGIDLFGLIDDGLAIKK